MRFKYYLRGCGFGILFAAIVLMIAFHSKINSLDNETIMERASELGMIMPKDTELQAEKLQLDTQQNAVPDLETDTEKTKSQSTKKTAEKSSEKKTDDAKTDSSEKKDNSKKDDSGKKKNSTQKDVSSESNEEVSLTIRRGEVCRQIAEDLYNLGMVEDAETFRKFMQEKDYDNRICVGTFKLKKGMTQEQIAQAIISQD